jgi:hypothetical protein
MVWPRLKLEIWDTGHGRDNAPAHSHKRLMIAAPGGTRSEKNLLLQSLWCSPFEKPKGEAASVVMVQRRGGRLVNEAQKVELGVRKVS